MNEQQDSVLTIEQQRRVVLAQSARGILASTTLISSSGPSADEVVRLASWLEGPDWFPVFNGEDVQGVTEEGPRDGWGDDVPPDEDEIRYTEDCEDAPTKGLLDITKPYSELSGFEVIALGRLGEAMRQLKPETDTVDGPIEDTLEQDDLRQTDGRGRDL